MVKYFYKKYEKDSHTDYKWKKYEANYHSGSTYYKWKKYEADHLYKEDSESFVKYLDGREHRGYPDYTFYEETGKYSPLGSPSTSTATRYQTPGSTAVASKLKVYRTAEAGDRTALYEKGSHQSGYRKGSLISSTTGSRNYKDSGERNPDGYWWERGSRHSTSGHYSKGSYISSTYASYNYKDDDQKNSDGYWWERGSSRTTYSKGSYIEEIIAEDGKYPDDGYEDNYWYVKQGRAREKISDLGVNTPNGNTILPIFKLSGYENQSSPLRIKTSNEIGYFELVNTGDSNASVLRIATKNGIKAIEQE